MPNYKLLSLTGDSGAGKDTIGEFLAQKLGYKRVSWATNLRRTLAKEFADAPSQYRQPGFIEPDKQWEASSGFLEKLIALPSEVKRDSRHRTLMEIQYLLHNGHPVVLVNSRLPQELTGIRVLGGQTWYVKSSHVRRPRQSSDDWMRGWKGSFDLTVENNGTISELHQQVLKLV